ncbi:MAG: 5/3-nucleotidase [Candidatus Sumerlaeota bacterium]|nr:5/3-nucleotidase [Candidatus Sumerlaeota bacterium]
MTAASLKNARILLTNDDGIDAEGLQTLRREIGGLCDLLVVAPMSERSGSSCGLSVGSEIAVQQRTDAQGRVWGYAVDGTPADCVKFALKALNGYRPDLVLSGINRGSNYGNSVWYSGTVAGAMEATLLGRRAMAVSLAHEWDPKVLNFEAAARATRHLIPWLLAQTWESRTFWNMNAPNRPFEQYEGIRFTRQGTSFYVDNFRVSRSEGETDYYLNIGESLKESAEPAFADDAAVDAGAVSLSLLRMDLTVGLPRSAAEALEREWNQLVFRRPAVDDPATR